MKIPASIYPALTGRQRLGAFFAALGRKDEAEAHRLRDSCPQVTFTGADPSFVTPLRGLQMMAVAVEADLRGKAMEFCAASQVAPDQLPRILEDTVAIQAAWNLLLRENGIDPEDMRLAWGARHRGVAALLKLASEQQVKANPEDVAAFLEVMREPFSKS